MTKEQLEAIKRRGRILSQIEQELGFSIKRTLPKDTYHKPYLANEEIHTLTEVINKDVPALVAEVEKLRDLLSRSLEAVESYCDCGPPGEEYHSEEQRDLIAEISKIVEEA